MLLTVVLLLMISPPLTAAAVIFDSQPFQEAEFLLKVLAVGSSIFAVGRVILTVVLIPSVWKADQNPLMQPKEPAITHTV